MSGLGVVLFQLGGPDSGAAVEPFLFNLFNDPDIIDFPLASIARRPLARLIARARASHVRRHYEEIGGHSPLREHTLAQAAALESELRKTCDARVVVAMRYWHPFTPEAIAGLERSAPDQVVLLPLYPQYSRTTTGSSLNEWNRCIRSATWRPNTHLVRDYHADPGFICALASAVDESLREFEHPEDVDVVFSAHSLPVSVVQAGDPYQTQVERTADLVWQRGRWPARRHLCYQSKVGTSKWLAPSMHETVEKLAAAGSRHVLVVPVSFVSDHVETLHEIAIEHRAQAEGLGIRDYRMMPGLNAAPRFIGALAKLVEQTLEAKKPGAA
jgi:protoporphyrin/coproporphyrin ferrochelatase